MNGYGATIYVRFQTENVQAFDEMMTSEHENYGVIPEELVTLKNEMQQNYDWIVPLDFRYFYALKEFELMGVLTHYRDAIDCVLELDQRLKELPYEVMITAGFGSLVLPDDYQSMERIRVLNEMNGHGVHSAFRYFKVRKKLKKEYDYYFYSFHHSYSHFNVKRSTLLKRKQQLEDELQQLQETDVSTNRHTYYAK